MGGLSEKCKGETVSIKKSYQKFDSEGKNKTKLRYRVLEDQISPEGLDIIDSPHHSRKCRSPAALSVPPWGEPTGSLPSGRGKCYVFTGCFQILKSPEIWLLLLSF